MNIEIPTQESQPDLLSEADILYEHATTGQRFLNFFIDILVMRFTLSYLTGTLIGMLLQILLPGYIDEVLASRSIGFYLLLWLIGSLNFVIYYTFCEKVFQGYTLGKLVTGTKAIREDGQPLTFRDALLRSLCRIVPFEPLSGFGTPWHDSWTNTVVIKTR